MLDAAWPARYSVSARVMLPDEQMVSIANAADDPQSAARPVTEQVAAYLRLKGQLIDPPMVRAQRPRLALTVLCLQYRNRSPGCTERDLVDALGPAPLAARPARTD